MTEQETIITTNSGVTVREMCGILQGYKELYLVIDGGCIDFNYKNPLHMEAFGDFVVSGVHLHNSDEEFGSAEYELEIARALIKRV